MMSREEYTDSLTKELADCIEFVSLQDLKGSLYFGGQHDKLKELVNMQWELLVIDEAHEGVDTSKTDVAFHQIKRNHTLHLSGTPFKALARKLKAHPVFGEYEIVVAAGDGRLSEEDESQNSYDKVRDAINHHEKLSRSQLDN